MRTIVVATCVVVMLSGVSLAQSTFRLAALEYRGRIWDNPTVTDPASSDQKWGVLVAGIDYHLTQQENAGTPVDLIVTSELPTYVSSSDGETNQAQYVPGPRTDAIAALAVTHNCWIVVNPAEKAPDYDTSGVLYHSTLVYNRQGELVANHHKHILPDDEFVAGPGPTVVSTEFGNMAVLNCWEIDANWPTQTLKHQQLIDDTMALNPHVIVHPTWGNYENEVAQVAADYDVYIASSVWDGPSLIAGPDGVLAEELRTDNSALPWQMALAVADVPIPEPTTAVLLAAAAAAKLLRRRRKR